MSELSTDLQIKRQVPSIALASLTDHSLHTKTSLSGEQGQTPSSFKNKTMARKQTLFQELKFLSQIDS